MKRAHFNLGVAYYQTGRLDESISEYKRVIEINPGYADAYVPVGTALFC